MITTNVAIINRIKESADVILTGTMLCIDPASISVGYALYVKGKLTTSGKVKATPKMPIHTRLDEIVSSLPPLSPDLVIIELVRSPGHIYLCWSAGAIIAHYGTPLIEIPQRLWKNAQDSKYFKDDEMDAKYMGKYVIEIAKGKIVERKV